MVGNAAKLASGAQKRGHASKYETEEERRQAARQNRQKYEKKHEDTAVDAGEVGDDTAQQNEDEEPAQQAFDSVREGILVLV